MSRKIFFAVFLLLSVFISYAANFSDTTQNDFNLGAYQNTSYNGNGIILNGINLTGEYLSRIFDAVSIARWDNLSYDYYLPFADVLYGADVVSDIWTSADSGVTWTKVNDDYNGADGNGVTEMSANSSGSLFITYNQQLWKSDNSGINWTKANDDVNGAGDSNAVAAMAIDNNNNIFIIDGSEDVLKSSDSGTTFTKANNTDFNNGNGAVFGLVSSSAGTLFTADAQSDVWKSENSGVSWVMVKDDYNGAEGNGGNDLLINSSGNLFIINGQDIWQSIDSGVSWTKINDDFNNGPDSGNGIAGIIDLNNTFYIADGSEDIYKSTNFSSVFTRAIENLNGASGNVKSIVSLRKYTNITFQTRNCSSSDCSDGVFTENNLNSLNKTGRYFQYRAVFSSEDSSISPKLFNVSLDYAVLDNTAPSFSGYTESPASNSDYSSSQSYRFNVTINESNIASVWIEFNNINYTSGISNISNIYAFTISNLGAGSYSYKWWANDTLGNLNNSGTRSYAINKAENILTLLSSSGWSYGYGTNSVFSCSALFGNPNMFISNVEVSNPKSILLGAGSYNIKCNISETGNYTSGIAQGSLTVSKASSQCSLVFDKTSPQNYGASITPYCSVITGEASSVLRMNGNIINSGQELNLGAGNYNFNCSLSETGNYTSSENISTFAINPAESSTNIILSPETGAGYGNLTNFSCENSNGLETSLYVNGEDRTSEKSIEVLRGAGNYIVNCTSVSGENYSGSSQQASYLINKAEGQATLKLNNQENDILIDYPEQYVVNASTIYGQVSIYKNGEEITGTNGMLVTPLREAAIYNITAVSSGDENYSSKSITRWINVTLDVNAPVISIVSPQEGATFGYNSSIPLEYSVSDLENHLQSCWYNLNNGENITLNSCQNSSFNVSSDGNYALNLYANDTLGNLNYASASFSVQVGSPTIILNSPIGVYLNSNNATFRYIPSDFDLNSCELWGDFTGNFTLNQTNNSPLNNAENTFSLVLPDGDYKWNIRCADLQGHSSFNGNKTFHVDTKKPLITITEPIGAKTSRTGIPLQFSINDSSPANCIYNVYRGLNAEIANTSINCNELGSFSVTVDADFILNLYATDYAGNSNFTNSSFSVSISSPPSAGGSSGGGGGGFSMSGNASRISRIELGSIGNMIVNPGDSKKISLSVKNTGTNFLNSCRLKGTGENSAWISSDEIKNIGNGEVQEFVFSLKIPLKISSGTYTIGISAECSESSKEASFVAEILERKLGLEIVEVKRGEGNSIKLIYSVSELSSQIQEAEIKLTAFDMERNKIAESVESVKLEPEEKKQIESVLEISDYSGDSINLVINADSGTASAFLQEQIVIGESSLSGLAVFIRSSNRDWAARGILIAVLSIVSFFVIRRVLRFRKMAGLHKVKDKGYVKVSERRK